MSLWYGYKWKIVYRSNVLWYHSTCPSTIVQHDLLWHAVNLQCSMRLLDGFDLRFEAIDPGPELVQRIQRLTLPRLITWYFMGFINSKNAGDDCFINDSPLIGFRSMDCLLVVNTLMAVVQLSIHLSGGSFLSVTVLQLHVVCDDAEWTRSSAHLSSASDGQQTATRPSSTGTRWCRLVPDHFSMRHTAR